MARCRRNRLSGVQDNVYSVYSLSKRPWDVRVEVRVLARLRPFLENEEESPGVVPVKGTVYLSGTGSTSFAGDTAPFIWSLIIILASWLSVSSRIQQTSHAFVRLGALNWRWDEHRSCATSPCCGLVAGATRAPCLANRYNLPSWTAAHHRHGAQWLLRSGFFAVGNVFSVLFCCHLTTFPCWCLTAMLTDVFVHCFPKQSDRVSGKHLVVSLLFLSYWFPGSSGFGATHVWVHEEMPRCCNVIQDIQSVSNSWLEHIGTQFDISLLCPVMSRHWPHF